VTGEKRQGEHLSGGSRPRGLAESVKRAARQQFQKIRRQPRVAPRGDGRRTAWARTTFKKPSSEGSLSLPANSFSTSLLSLPSAVLEPCATRLHFRSARPALRASLASSNPLVQPTSLRPFLTCGGSARESTSGSRLSCETPETVDVRAVRHNANSPGREPANLVRLAGAVTSLLWSGKVRIGRRAVELRPPREFVVSLDGRLAYIGRKLQPSRVVTAAKARSSCRLPRSSRRLPADKSKCTAWPASKPRGKLRTFTCSPWPAASQCS
jgi:hypothetical protein